MPPAISPPASPWVVGDVLLRPFSMDDAPAIVAAGDDPDIVRNTFMPQHPTPDEADAWLGRATAGWGLGVARLAIVAADDPDNRCVGQIGLAIADHPAGNAETFYWLLPQGRGRGWATTALTAASQWGFGSLALERITALIHVDNAPSQATVERAGFVREGVLRSYDRTPRRGRVDLISYSLLPSDLAGHREALDVR